jgi:hypothetical protein
MRHHTTPMDFFKEWRCNSRAYARVSLFFACILGLIALFSIKSVVISTVSGISAVFLYSKFLSIKRRIKQVSFTPSAIYVEKQKIDICYLKSITFTRSINSRHNFFLAYEFNMKFFANPELNEEINFYMEFGSIFFSNAHTERNGRYDYENRFINVLLNFAKKRRVKLKMEISSEMDDAS